MVTVLFAGTLFLAFFQSTTGQDSLVHFPSDVATNVKQLLRFGHLVAGVAWIGILYFFNLVNVPMMKKLDGPTKGKVIPELMPKALWYFRWGAVVTVLTGLTYFAMYLLAVDAKNKDYNPWALLGTWLLIVLVTYAIIYAVIKPDGPTSKGEVLAAIIAVLVIIMSVAMLYAIGKPGIGNRSLSIAIGGGLGVIMLLNVWGIIWRCQKKIIAWTKDNAENGTPIPPESAKLARQAFLASRTNFWLSFLMLFFMSAAHDWPIFGR